MIDKKSSTLKILSFTFLITLLFSVSACKSDDNDDSALVAAPTVSAATDITATTFKVSWTEVADAEVYLLDVSPEAFFSPKVTDFDKKELTVTSATVIGLTAKTKYYYRVYAKKGTTYSLASSVKSTTTIE